MNYILILNLYMQMSVFYFPLMIVSYIFNNYLKFVCSEFSECKQKQVANNLNGNNGHGFFL